MKRSEKQFARVLVEQLEGASEAQVKKVAYELVQELAARRALPRLRGIIAAIDGAWKERYGASTVTVETAYPLSEALRKKVTALAPGAEIRERVDAGLIGGARVRLDDLVVDGTINGQLQRLQTAFSNI